MTIFGAIIKCCICSEKAAVNVELPTGWAVPELQSEECFCPKHAPVKKFVDSQCPGCVGSWGDCGMWEAFAYRQVTITPEQIATIRRGVCPLRVNGTFGCSPDGVEAIDISGEDRAGGIAFADAIGEYLVKHARKL